MRGGGGGENYLCLRSIATAGENETEMVKVDIEAIQAVEVDAEAAREVKAETTLSKKS